MTATSATSATAMQSKPRPWWLIADHGHPGTSSAPCCSGAAPRQKLDTYMLLVTFLGIWWLVQGIFDIIFIFIDHTAWGWKLFIGIVSIIAGASILTYPVAAALALPKIFVLVLGIWGLMYGIILLIMAFQGGGWGSGYPGRAGHRLRHRPDG